MGILKQHSRLSSHANSLFGIFPYSKQWRYPEYCVHANVVIVHFYQIEFSGLPILKWKCPVLSSNVAQRDTFFYCLTATATSQNTFDREASPSQQILDFTTRQYLRVSPFRLGVITFAQTVRKSAHTAEPQHQNNNDSHALIAALRDRHMPKTGPFIHFSLFISENLTRLPFLCKKCPRRSNTLLQGNISAKFRQLNHLTHSALNLSATLLQWKH